jgi:subtilisin family serine protease
VPTNRLAALRADENVAYVEPDGEMTTVAQTVPWGITKIGASGAGTVSNVRAYVIDTGIDTGHSDLNVVGHVNFAGGKNSDCHGHGTHVAGTVAAKANTQDVVGVAPGAPLVGVKVLGCGGSGTTSGVIRGVEWVTANAVKPAVANMSLGGGASQALDDAVRNSAASGVFYALAAGNSGANACNSSPARAGAGTNNGIATTAATDSLDSEASWSNYGSCVDIWAPGVSILSTRLKGGTTTMSGTSMASPHVAGGGALYLSTHGGSPSAVESALKSAATVTPNTSKDGRAITRLYVGGF